MRSSRNAQTKQNAAGIPFEQRLETRYGKIERSRCSSGDAMFVTRKKGTNDVTSKTTEQPKSDSAKLRTFTPTPMPIAH